MKKILQKTKEITNTILSRLIACIAPTLPIMIGVGMLKALLILSLSGLIAGTYAGLMGVKSFAMASFGIFGIVSTIGEGSSILHAAIALILGCLAGFVSAFMTHHEQRR